MESIREQLVAKPADKDDFIKKGIILMAALLLAVAAAVGIAAISRGFLSSIGVLLGFGIMYFGWRLAGSINVEYEYAVIGDELRINKIMNKRSRKTLCEMRLRSAEGFYSCEKRLQDATEINACGDGARYSIEYSDPQYGRTVIVFTPDERTIEAIKPYLPRLQ